MRPFALLSLSLLMLGQAFTQALTSRPNFVLLLVDDLPWWDIGAGENPLDRITPTFRRLASEGMFFERAYTASPACSPSRAALITGMNPLKTGIVRHINGGKDQVIDEYGIARHEVHFWEEDPSNSPSRNWLRLKDTTLAEALKPHDYESVFMGKWHLGHEPYHPIYQGFDRQFGVSNFGSPKSYHAPFWPGRSATYTHAKKGTYITDQLTDDAVHFLETVDARQQFFLSLWYYGVHTPHQGRENLLKRARVFGFEGRMAHFAAMVMAVDASLHRINKTIALRPQIANTMIILTSDQGGYFSNPPLKGNKREHSLYEGGARIPLIVKWPTYVEKGSRCREIVVTTDLFPTLLELAGGDASDHPDLEGMNIAPLFLGEQESLPREEVYLYKSYINEFATIRSGPWAFTAYRDGSSELFDVEADVGQENDLAAEHPERVQTFQKKLEDWLNQ